MPGQKILIVEDEGILALNLKITLTELGYEVLDISPTGEQAIELAYDLSPDLVIMDIKLAGSLDGIEAAAIIRRNTQVPIMFLSAHSDTATYNKAMSLNPAGFLKKPVEEYCWGYLIEEALQKN
jgi:DNA-binding NarL/FixJ family response regulator